MICTKCGKGELQELTGTEMLICPLCSCKLISPNAHKYVPQFQTDGWTEDYLDKMETLVGYLKHISGKYYFNLPQELPRVIKEAEEFLKECKSNLPAPPGKG